MSYYRRKPTCFVFGRILRKKGLRPKPRWDSFSASGKGIFWQEKNPCEYFSSILPLFFWGLKADAGFKYHQSSFGERHAAGCPGGAAEDLIEPKGCVAGRGLGKIKNAPARFLFEGKNSNCFIRKMANLQTFLLIGLKILLRKKWIFSSKIQPNKIVRGAAGQSLKIFVKLKIILPCEFRFFAGLSGVPLTLS